jgi:sensor c-di-GMP phosphodiesterase-like protein
MTTEGRGLAGNTLYETRCSDPGFDCVTASASVSEALHGESGLISSSAFVGGIAGILIGMVFSLQYNRRKRAMNQQLRRALQRDELKVLYQPIVNLETRQIVGAEALARWTNEDGNAVEPEVFVKIAEDFGFVGSITKTVLKRILRDFATTLQNHEEFRISINVAAADLEDPDLLPMLECSLQKANVRPESLVIEITERSAANSEETKETIRNLRRLGHSIHIDDFGCGYSNLDKLLYLWADTIKIDKAFTKVIGTESRAAAILPQIMNLAKSMNLEVVVEGVECTRQADYFLPDEQKIYAQGWLYGRPMSAEAVLSELAGNPVVAPAALEGFAMFAAKPGMLQGGSTLVA